MPTPGNSDRIKSGDMKTIKKTKKPVSRKKKTKPIIEVSDIGVSLDQILGPSRQYIPHPEVREIKEAAVISIFHQPLASSRVSFWVGVMFGFLVIGALAVLSWQYIRIELLESTLLGWGI